MTFIRKRENFICGHCRKRVKGDGYTNHCPYCLWSKHVDDQPGDRANKCKGLMEPIRVQLLGRQDYEIYHKCLECGVEKKKKALDNDNFEIILSLVKKENDKRLKG
ncbi:MAG: RNHCP domain-containing protein [Candidatus Komeilibacteria bacterium]|nr:RNHCP domain-containing protein [Candidatus Komeilibacteria bacterium]